MDDAAEISKSVLIINDTSDAKVTLFTYSAHDPLCWLSSSSKIIEPGKNYLYRSRGSFKFELRAHGEKSKRKTMQPVKEWETPTACIVTGCVEDSSVKVEEKSLADFPQENQICIRQQNMEKEISEDCGRNLYEILKLNIKDVRKEETEKQNEMIKEAYHREMLQWHPDCQQGPVDDNICKEIIMAYSVLGDPEKRAKYNNLADYDNGWLSKSRWKSIFWPDCNSKEQVYQYRKRMAFTALSVGILVGGMALAFSTAGLAAPVVIGCAVAGGGIVGKGIQCGVQAVSRESIENSCDTKKYLTGREIDGAAGAHNVDSSTRTNHEAKSENDGRICYISEGAWKSKLIVQYTNDKNEVVKKEESGSGSSIEIPENAKDVEVRFQVLRFIGTWCDVKKYDRFDECWSEPAEPHIFEYKQPPIRTFTISGGLYFEAVMKVTDEHYNEVRDM